MARKKRRSTPHRKQKRSTSSTPKFADEKNEDQKLHLFSPPHFPVNSNPDFPTRRTDTHFTGVAQGSS